MPLDSGSPAGVVHWQIELLWTQTLPVVRSSLWGAQQDNIQAVSPPVPLPVSALQFNHIF